LTVTLENPDELGPQDALLVVDVQRDFCPGGALPVPNGDRVVAVLNRWSERAARAGATVVATRDWHPPGHASFFERGGPWPEHCVQGTPGAEFHPDLMLPSGAIVLSKGQEPDRDAYSAFDGTGLSTLLRDRGIRRVFVGGLAEDVCVRATVLDALRSGFQTHLIADATLPVDKGEGARALREMQDGHAIVERSESAP
jgi:nicotinamidase/pyrazinamidase